MNIGLIGAENSHAATFCQIYNGEKKHPGFTVTHVYGADSAEACAKLCAEYALTECRSEEDVIRACDALVITYRKGSLHYAPAMEALRAGKAVFNDKPFATSAAQAREIADYAAKNHLLLCGGSNVKSLPGLGPVAELIGPGATVMISFCADPKSEYDGFWFYGIHSVEVCVKLLGLDYKAVSACRNGESVIASVSYGDKRCVIVNTPDASDLNISVMGENTSATHFIPMDYAAIGPNQFADMIRTGKPPYGYDFYAGAVGLLEEIIAQAGLA